MFLCLSVTQFLKNIKLHISRIKFGIESKHFSCITLGLQNLPTNHIFQPIAVENLGAFSSSSSDFISALGHKISSVSSEERETLFLFQHLSVALQRFSADCTTLSCPSTIQTNSHSSSVLIAFNPLELYTQGYKKN